MSSFDDAYIHDLDDVAACISEAAILAFSKRATF